MIVNYVSVDLGVSKSRQPSVDGLGVVLGEKDSLLLKRKSLQCGFDGENVATCLPLFGVRHMSTVDVYVQI